MQLVRGLILQCSRCQIDSETAKKGVTVISSVRPTKKSLTVKRSTANLRCIQGHVKHKTLDTSNHNNRFVLYLKMRSHGIFKTLACQPSGTSLRQKIASLRIPVCTAEFSSVMHNWKGGRSKRTTKRPDAKLQDENFIARILYSFEFPK